MIDNVLYSARIQSKSDQDKTYFVRLVENELGKVYWLCGCRAFLFGKRKDKLCSHIDEAITKYKGDKYAKAS